MPRSSQAAAQARALDAALRSLYRALETRPVPEVLRAIVGQLDQAARAS